jgi:hypothetical protein
VEKESMTVFADHVREMNERVIELSRSHAILWVFWDTGNCKRYSKILRDHQDFFDTMASSLFQGFCVITYQLFELGKRGDVKSLPALINYLSSLDRALELEMKAKIDAQRPLLDKFFSFRHKIYAHRDKSKPPWEVFQTQSKTRLKDEMEAVVLLAQNVVCALAEAAGVKAKGELAEAIRLREEYAGGDANRILEALKK